MKTIEEIYKEVNESEKDYNQLNNYISILEQEIGGDRKKLLLYRYECAVKTDSFGESTIWLSVAAIMISLFSILTNMIVGEKEIPILVILLVLAMLFYYLKTVNKKRRYELLSFVLEEIDRKLQ